MRYCIAAGVLAAALLGCSAVTAKDLESGPQVGSKITKPFDPLHVNGPSAGTKACLV